MSRCRIALVLPLLLKINWAHTSHGAASQHASNKPLGAGKKQFFPHKNIETHAVDNCTLDRKVMTGYQGWFNTPQDGSNVAKWRHWSSPEDMHPTSDTVVFEMWPDMREYNDATELEATGMTYANGTAATLFSSYHYSTVLRHVEWTKTYGIDGLFVQRFLVEVTNGDKSALRNERDVVLNHVRRASELHGRVFANMYDISGFGNGNLTLFEALQRDWMYLVDTLSITSSHRYLHHRGKPVLALWGFGVEGRNCTPEEASRIVTWFTKTAPAPYQVTLVGGIDGEWRKTNDDPRWISDVFAHFDVLSPWTVGRYRNAAEADAYRQKYIEGDLKWTKEQQPKSMDYLPVIFPGFSWQNLHHGSTLLNDIPRMGGTFLWRQVYNALDAGASMLYVAMLDEVNEGTAIFKVAEGKHQIPSNATFLTLDVDGYDLPSDWYLRLTGLAGKVLKGELPLTEEMPLTPRKIWEREQ